MKKINNYLKKGIISFVPIIMLLVIPNLDVYSSIGSYQSASRAITANKNYTFLNNADSWVKNKFSGKESIKGLLGIMGTDYFNNLTLEDQGILEATAKMAAESLAAALKAQETQGHSLASKYDFQ